MCAWATAIIGDNLRGINGFHLHFADKGCTEYIRSEHSNTDIFTGCYPANPGQVYLKM
jgi:hypothetical protein